VRQPEERKTVSAHERVDEYRNGGGNRSPQSALRELEDGETNKRDVLMYESILAVEGRYVWCCCFLGTHTVLYIYGRGKIESSDNSSVLYSGMVRI
jgi:hypothetical protein